MGYEIRIGQILTDYSSVAIRVERVAAGGMGLVAMGPNIMAGGSYPQDRWFVLKTIKPAALDDNPGLRDRFVREGLTWKGLWPHANITMCQAVTKIDGLPFLILNYAKFGSLADVLQQGRLPQELAVPFAQHIAAGLAYLHTPDPAYLRPDPLVHRDLKPDNILVTAEGLAQITDFGLVAALQAQHSEDADTGEDEILAPQATNHFHTRLGQRGMGTVSYMAPEQWEGAAQEAADCYALGIILFEVFTGHYPYARTPQMTQRDWRRMHQEATPASVHAYVPELPVPIARVIAALLAKEPADRPTASQALAALQNGAQAIGEAVYTPPEVFAHTPDHERIHWHNLANAYDTFHLYKEALARNDQAYAIAPLDGDVLGTRGNIYKAQQQWAAAERWYQEALQVCPADDAVKRKAIYNNLGNLYNEQGRAVLGQGQGAAAIALYANAEAMFAQAVAHMPDAANTWYNRASNQRLWGDLLQEQGEATAGRDHLMLALQAYRRAEALGLRHPQLVAALAYTGRLLAQ